MKIVKTYFALLCLSLLALIVIATDDAAAQEPKAAPVDDPAYIAEDPSLARLVGSPGPMLSKVTPLMSKDLTECPGKEVTMITVEYAPGESDVIQQYS